MVRAKVRVGVRIRVRVGVRIRVRVMVRVKVKVRVKAIPQDHSSDPTSSFNTFLIQSDMPL